MDREHVDDDAGEIRGKLRELGRPSNPSFASLPRSPRAKMGHRIDRATKCGFSVHCMCKTTLCCATPFSRCSCSCSPPSPNGIRDKGDIIATLMRAVTLGIYSPIKNDLKKRVGWFLIIPAISVFPPFYESTACISVRGTMMAAAATTSFGVKSHSHMFRNAGRRQ